MLETAFGSMVQPASTRNSLVQAKTRRECLVYHPKKVNEPES